MHSSHAMRSLQRAPVMGSQGSSSHSKLQCTLILPNQTSRACDRAARSATRVQAAATSSADATSATSTLESSVDETLDNTFKKQLSDLGVTTITADQLFDGVHVLKWTPLLLAYFPVGCILAAIRMLAWAGGVSLDASWFRNKAVVDMYMALLGVTVIWEDQHNIPAELEQRYVHLITTALPTKVYACQNLPAILQPANKHTYLSLAQSQQQQQQHAAMPSCARTPPHHDVSLHGDVAQQLSCSSPDSSRDSSQPGLELKHSPPVQHLKVDDLPCVQQQSAQHAPYPRPNLQSHAPTSSTARQRHTVPPSAFSQRSSGQQPPVDQEQPSIHLFPEGGMTNGKGMMRFSRGFMLFADKLPVVPVALRVRTAFPQINAHTINSSFFSNLFWFSFQPWTVITARALPAMCFGDDYGSKAAFVQRVQMAIAEDLHAWVADINIQQKRQMAGTHFKQQRQRRQQQQQLRSR